MAAEPESTATDPEDASARPPVLEGLRVERLLARGRRADVWLAWDAAGPVALKVARGPVPLHELEALRRYRVVAQDPRTGLLPILQLARCAESGRPCTVLPLADPLQGPDFDSATYRPATLRAVLDARGALAPEAVVALAHDVLEGLAELHARGLVHRDVRPSMLLRYHGRWCLADTARLGREGEAEDVPRSDAPELPPEERPRDERSADVVACARALTAALGPSPAEEPGRGREESALARRLRRVLAAASAPRPAGRDPGASALLHALEGPGRVVTGGLALVAAAVASLLVTVVLVAWIGRDREVEAATRAERPAWEVARLTPRWHPPGSRALCEPGFGARVRVGSSLIVSSEPAPFGHVALVTATYRDGVRVVEASAPLALPGGHPTFGASVRGEDAVGFLLGEAAPLLFVLVGSDEPWRTDALEARVAAALDAAGDWPAQGPPAAAPGGIELVFHGERCEPLETGGTGAAPAGDPRVEAGPRRLLAALRGSFPAFDGMLLRVEP